MLQLRSLIASRHLCVAVVLALVAAWEPARAVAAALDDTQAVDADNAAAKSEPSGVQEGNGAPEKKKKKKASTEDSKDTKQKARHPGFSVGKTLSVELTGRIEGGVREASSA